MAAGANGLVASPSGHQQQAQHQPLTKEQIQMIIEKGGLKNIDAASLNEIMQMPQKQIAAEATQAAYLSLFQQSQNGEPAGGSGGAPGTHAPVNMQNYNSHNIS